MLPSAGSGQDLQLVHRSWTLRDHAPRFIGALAQDRDGYLWIGSNDGLFRFDGLVFERITPPPGQRRTAIVVTALVADPSGGVWVGYGGHGGVSRFANGVMLSARMPKPPLEITDLSFDRTGRLWASGSGEMSGLWRLAGREWRETVMSNGQPIDQPGKVFVARNGTTWIPAWGDLFYQRRGSGILERAPFKPKKVSSLFEDRHDVLWLLDTEGLRGLPAWDEGARSAPRPPVARSPANQFIKAIMDDRARIWAVTVTSGAFSVLPADGKIGRITEANGLASDRAWAVLSDRGGNIWIGSERGLDRFRTALIKDVPDLPRNAPMGYHMAVVDGRVFVASGDAVWSMTVGRPSRLAVSIREGVSALCAGASHQVWALDDDEAIAVSGPNRGERVRLPDSVSDLPSCAVDREGALWVASDTFGLVQLRNGAWRRHMLSASLGVPYIVTIDRRNRPVVITKLNAIVRLDGTRLQVWHGDRIGFEQPLAFGYDAPQLVLGGVTGLLRLGEHGSEKLDVSDHPWLRNIKGITAQPDGRTWLIGYYGIFRVATKALDQAFAHPHRPIPHETFDQDDARIAVPQRNVGLQAATGGDGSLWMLTRRGVMTVGAGVTTVGMAPPFSIRIASAKLPERTYADPHDLKLPNNPGTLTLVYGALDLTTALQRRYRTMLQGADDRWVDREDGREVSFANLSPGSYRFVVQTNGRMGEWQEPGAALAFTVAPAFYQTRWFLILSGLVVLTLIWIGHRWRMSVIGERMRRRARTQAEERERIARELHDTFLQSVQGLMLRFQAIADTFKPTTRERVLMEAALNRSDDVLLEGRERVMSLRTDRVQGDLRANLTSTVGREADIAFNGADREIVDEVVEEIDAIVSEAVSNARRHAGADHILVTVEFESRALTVTIADDGIGIDPAIELAGAKPGHFGLIGMRERARVLKARLVVSRRASGGTSVQVVVPSSTCYVRQRWWRTAPVIGPRSR